MTVGGNHLQYNGKTSTELAGLETIKIHLNSTISTKNAKYAATDIRNFYTNSKLDLPEYIRIHLSLIPQEIIEEYDAMKFVDINGYVYVEVTGVMYGLAQSGRIANQDLQLPFTRPAYKRT